MLQVRPQRAPALVASAMAWELRPRVMRKALHSYVGLATCDHWLPDLTDPTLSSHEPITSAVCVCSFQQRWCKARRQMLGWQASKR